MSDNRTVEEIEKTARILHAVFAGGQGLDREGIAVLWDGMPALRKDGWRALARSVRGVIHHEDATSGGFATAPQGDRIRELRSKYLMEDGREKSWIGSETRPYGDMVVLFEHPGGIGNWRIMGWIIHPDGHYEELHRERVG